MRTVPLKWLAHINGSVLSEETDPGFEFRYIDIGGVGRGFLTESPQSLTFATAPSRARRMVASGDVIVSTVRTYLRAVWPVVEGDEPLIASTGFAVLRPGPLLYPRYLGWLAQSDLLIEEIVARSTGVSYPALNSGQLGDILVPVPTLSRQREVVNCLDAETARIDALILSKDLLIARLREHAASVADLMLTDSRRRSIKWIAARRVCPQITVGVVVDPSAYFTDEGVPFVHGTDVQSGWIDDSSLKYMSAESNALLRKSQLHAGDVVAMRVGEPGRAAVVPASLEGANCASILIFRRSPLLASGLLAAFLNSTAGRSQISALQYGAAQSVLNVAHAKELKIPVPPEAEQAAIERRLNDVTRYTTQTIRLLQRQLSLLREHRQALITAAVGDDIHIAGSAA